jgi:hypothetical protein
MADAGVADEDPAIESAQAHLHAELHWLELLLERQVQRLRARRQLVENEFRGYYIPDDQVDALLHTAAQRTQPVNTHSRADVSDRNLATAIASQRAAIDRQESPHYPLPVLARRFGLSWVERALLLVAAAPAIDLRYETLYGYVQNDFTRKAPTLALALQLLEIADATGATLNAAHPLLRHHLLRLVPDPQEPQPPRLAHYLKVDECVAAFLLGKQEMDDRIFPFAQFQRPDPSPGRSFLDESHVQRLVDVAAFLAHHRALIVLTGADHLVQQAAAAIIADTLKRELLVADLSAALNAGQPLDQLLPLLLRQTLLQEAALYLHLPEPATLALSQRVALLSMLESALCPLLLGYAHPWYPEERWPTIPFLFVSLPSPDYQQRQTLWAQALGEAAQVQDGALATLASRFALPAGKIAEAAQLAVTRARARPAGEQEVGLDDLNWAARARSSHSLQTLAQKVEPKYHWGDIILPAAVLRQLREVYNGVKYRHVVYSRWGFEKKLALGKGLNSLFSGPSGVGKTMAADILANELGLDLYKIDLSTVVSKYIGETEKNLGEIFAAAQASNAILFFDEADALFGKRSEVKDARDRYANIETAYLLQKIEEYDGVAILATNLYGNVDEAFARRLHHLLEFPFPDARHRERMWRQVFPTDTPVAENVDFVFLARQFELSGGNIRNVALSAAFLAAEAESAVTMDFLVLGVARELQKMSKMPAKADFREYYTVVQALE